MIICLLDGKKAYPVNTDKIKVTYENQFVKDSGSYTYDISFPLDIADNRKVFGNVQRMDVKKNLADFEECRLYADNRLIISGKGTVTSITNTTVKVQIVGGKSRIKYNSKFEKHHIDEIKYDTVNINTGKVTWSLDGSKEGESVNLDGAAGVDLTKVPYVGMKDVAVFVVVFDENKNGWTNILQQTGTAEQAIQFHWAVQPFLMYIIKKVAEYEGYKITENDFDKDPWNRLVIVSAKLTRTIKGMLPHWTVYKFFDEIRKFFNASLIFDEVTKTLKIKAANELLNNDAVSYECLDEFSVEHDDEGLSNLATSNISYNFDDATNRSVYETIPLDVLENYTIKEYSSKEEAKTASSSMKEKEKLTTIFKVGTGYYVWLNLAKEGEKANYQFVIVGFFSPLIRDKNSDETEELNISPAAIKGIDPFYPNTNVKFGAGDFAVASVANSGTDEKEMEDEDGTYYTTVQSAIEAGAADKEEETEDDSRLPVAFLAKNLYNVAAQKVVAYNQTFDGENTWMRQMVLYTDFRMSRKFLSSDDTGTLSLEGSATVSRSFGHLDGNTPGKSIKWTSKYGSYSIDKDNCQTIKFITDKIPDPKDIYIFHNKKYICEKIEMEVTDEGVSKEKTGYFYEIL